MRRVVWLTGILILTACSSSPEDGFDVENQLMSTGSVANNSNIELENFLEGEWLEIGTNCNSKGYSCETLESKSRWAFRRGEVEWNNFTHPLFTRNDTIFIAGLPYRIASEQKDTVLFHAVNANNYFKLVRD